MKNQTKYWLFLSLLVTFLISFCQNVQAQEKKVLVLEIKEEIDPRMSRYVELGLKEAKEKNFDIIIVDMNTYGGMVSDADDIRGALLAFPKPVFVFINDNAASAGSLISIACDSIYMSPGATIGASTVVDQSGKAVSDKYQSYMRAKMRVTAEANGRDPKIAEAFVGVNVSKDSIYHEGKVLTLSTSEAIKVNYCDGEVNSIEEILKLNHIDHYQLTTFHLSVVEKIEAFFLNPYLRSILILIILGGLYFELQTPGVGFPIVASIVAAILYFVPSYLYGFAENWEILIFIIGIILIALEIFVIPGFGIAGISGIILSLAGLLLVMIDNDFFDFSMVSTGAWAEALSVLLIGTFGSVILLFAGGKKILESKAFKKLTLQEELKTSHGYTSAFFKEPMIGKTGIAYTVLRPSGKILIGDDIYDAFSRNDFIEKGTEVIVIEENTTSLKVKRKE